MNTDRTYAFFNPKLQFPDDEKILHIVSLKVKYLDGCQKSIRKKSMFRQSVLFFFHKMPKLISIPIVCLLVSIIAPLLNRFTTRYKGGDFRRNQSESDESKWNVKSRGIRNQSARSKERWLISARHPRKGEERV